jgi:hypothetical protein
MGESDLRTKHVIAAPVIIFNGDKALVETNAIIVGENIRLGVGCTTHNRFYDRVEKRAGCWRIINRQSIYDMGSATFPVGPVDINAEKIGAYPREYAALAYVLELSGLAVAREFATRGSSLERDMKAQGASWLGA